MKTCPYCVEQIQDNTIKCRYCGEWLDGCPRADTSSKAVCSGYGYDWNYEYKSEAESFGWPLIHIAQGINPETGTPRVARGVITIGNIAVGGLALGGLALGDITFGGLGLGLFSFGGLAIGILAAGHTFRHGSGDKRNGGCTEFLGSISQSRFRTTGLCSYSNRLLSRYSALPAREPRRIERYSQPNSFGYHWWVDHTGFVGA